jgi:hypothetical protein
LNKTATASSTSGSNTAGNATSPATWQNYLNTKWLSNTSDPQWLMVDLGSAMAVNRVICKWDSAYAKSFKIQVATDTASWKDVYSTTKAGARSVTDETFATTTARYVRIYGTQQGNASKGYGIFDLMVLNDSGVTEINSNLNKPSIAPGSFLASRNNVLQYRVPTDNSVKIDLIDGRGRLGAVLVDGYKNAGDHEVILPAKLGRGMYIVRFVSGTTLIASQRIWR